MQSLWCHTHFYVYEKKNKNKPNTLIKKIKLNELASKRFMVAVLPGLNLKPPKDPPN